MAIPDTREIAAEQRLLNEPLYQAAQPKILELIEGLQGAESPEQFMRVHREALAEFGGRQEAFEETLPRAMSAAAGEIRELVQQDPKPLPQIAEQQQILDRAKRLKRPAVAVQHILREIGDGIAWRALRYDRAAFTILGGGQRVGRFASGVGLDAEFLELGRLWDEERAFAIHNDMTNCLRHGDLTIVRPQDVIVDVTLAEVKAGPSRDEAQLQRLERATTLLRQRRLLAGGEQGKPLQITIVPGEYDTYLDALTPLIAEARKVGYGWIRPHECMLVGAADYRVWGRDADEYNERSQRARHEVGWLPEKPDTLAWMASLKRMRDRKETFSSIAPFTIYPLPAEDVADIVMGFIDLVFCLDLAALEKALSDEDIAVDVARPPESERRFLTGERRGLTTTVPPHLREQMMVELMTPAALWRAVTHVLDDMEADPATAGDQRIVVFEGERSVWEQV